MPLMQLKMLVLPAPLGPMMAKKSWAGTSRLTPDSAATPAKLRCSPSRASRAIRPSGPRAPRPGEGKRQRGSGRPARTWEGYPGIRTRAWVPRRPDGHFTSARNLRETPGPVNRRRDRSQHYRGPGAGRGGRVARPDAAGPSVLGSRRVDRGVGGQVSWRVNLLIRGSESV